MEGLSVPGTPSSYDIIVVWEYFDDYVRARLNAVFEREFHRLIACFGIKDITIVIDFEDVAVAFLS